MVDLLTRQIPVPGAERIDLAAAENESKPRGLLLPVVPVLPSQAKLFLQRAGTYCRNGKPLACSRTTNHCGQQSSFATTLAVPSNHCKSPLIIPVHR